MIYNIVLINTLQREIKRRQARNRHIFRLISLFLPPLPEQKSSQCREGVSLTENLWRRYGIFSQISQIIFFGGEGYDFTQISQISQIFLSHRSFRRRWIKRVIISLLRLCDFRNAMLVARKCSRCYPLSLNVGKIKRNFSTKFA